MQPISVYGRGRTGAERAVLGDVPDNGLILRTTWQFGAPGKNFASTLLGFAETRDHATNVGSATCLELACAVFAAAGHDPIAFDRQHRIACGGRHDSLPVQCYPMTVWARGPPPLRH